MENDPVATARGSDTLARLKYVRYMDFAETTLADLRDRVGRGEITARAAAESALDAAEKLNETLNAFLEINREGALKRADEIDARITAGETPALPVPIAIKDNICVK